MTRDRRRSANVQALPSGVPCEQLSLFGAAEDLCDRRRHAPPPIPAYERLNAAEAIRRVKYLSNWEAAEVRRWERSGKRRALVLAALEARLRDGSR